MNDQRQAWERSYQQNKFDQLEWFQSDPETSLALIGTASEAQPVIDIGSGSSLLVDRLVACGFTDITLLDFSPTALDQVHQRLKEHQNKIKLIAADILSQPLPPKFRCWHDRGLLHLLTNPADRQRYVERLKGALLPGGSVILAGFASNTSSYANGLPTLSHEVDALKELLGPQFELRTEVEQNHLTPSGTEQPYLFTQWRRIPR